MLNSHVVFGSLHSTVLLHVAVAHYVSFLCYSIVWPIIWWCLKFLIHSTLNGHFSCFQFLPVMCIAAMNICVFCLTYTFIFSYTICKNIYTERFYFFSKIFVASFSELFPIGPILTRGFYFPPSCHKSWPCDLLCPVKHDRNNVCHFWPEALRTITWFCHCAFHSDMRLA